MAASTGRESEKFVIRLPDGMRDRIKASADANNRSMNAEIIATLEDAYPPPFSTAEVKMLVQWTLKMYCPRRVAAAGISDEMADDMYKFMLFVAQDVLGEADPEDALRKIETEKLEGSEAVSLFRLDTWLQQMRGRYLLAQSASEIRLIEKGKSE